MPPELWVPALGGEPGPAAAEERHTRPMEVRSSKLHGAPAGLRHRLPSEWARAYTDCHGELSKVYLCPISNLHVLGSYIVS